MYLLVYNMQFIALHQLYNIPFILQVLPVILPYNHQQLF